MTKNSAYLDYGGASQVEFKSEVTEIAQAGRWSSKYKAGVDNAEHENLGKGDRIFKVSGGPITLAEVGRLKTHVESTSTVHFRSEATNNADVDVVVLGYKVVYDSAGYGSQATAQFNAEVTMRESV